MNTQAIILAAGKGMRMKSSVPKALGLIGGRPMLARVIGSLKKAGVKRMTVVVGYKAGLVKEKFAGRVKFVEQKKLLGSGDAVKKALRSAGASGNVIVTCVDMPLVSGATYKNLVKKHESSSASCAVLTARAADPFSYGRIIRDYRGNISKIVEEKDLSGDEGRIDEVNTGVYCFDAASLKKYICKVKKNKRKKEFYLTDVVGILASAGKKVSSEDCPPEEAVGVNSRVELAEADRLIRRRVNEALMENGVTIVDPETAFIDETAAIGRDTVIFPCTVVEKDVKIGNSCRVGPFARIRPKSRIADSVSIGTFAEVNRTTVGNGTKIKHHAYLGDAVIGKNVNIGAGAVTANYDKGKKNRTVIKDGAFIGVNATLIAPVTVGRNAKVGAGSVVTKNKNVPDGATVVGVPARLFES